MLFLIIATKLIFFCETRKAKWLLKFNLNLITHQKANNQRFTGAETTTRENHLLIKLAF